MRQLWEQSVDELDASVSLEADGVNDTVAANRFGVRDVADLAEQLTMLVPVRVPAETPDDLGKPIPYLRLACRGLLFAVPGPVLSGDDPGRPEHEPPPTPWSSRC